MNSQENLQTSLAEAARLLDASAAPAWLAAVVRESGALAGLLALRKAPERRPADFYYPH